MGVVELGHTGVWVTDLDVMRDFYTQVVGLTVTDSDDDFGIVFLSSRPNAEHHEMVLQRGRRAPDDVHLVHQISWRVDSYETLQDCHRRLVEHEVRIQQVVTHGNAFGIYFFDPEGNRNEFYWSTGVDVQQPFRRNIDVDVDEGDALQMSQELVTDDQPRYQPVT
jgi:catechol-2,3-dioxygenase